MKKTEQILEHARVIESTIYAFKHAVEFARYVSNDAERLLIGDHVSVGMDSLLDYQNKFMDELVNFFAEMDGSPDDE